MEAMIHATLGRMNSGTLAWSFLPNGGCNEDMEQQYNRAVNWTWKTMLDTIIHELGHAIGLSHGPSGSIMQPFVNGSFSRPQSKYDIPQSVKRYGPPKPVTPPVDPPTTDPELHQVLEGGFRILGLPGNYAVVKTQDTDML